MSLLSPSRSTNAGVDLERIAVEHLPARFRLQHAARDVFARSARTEKGVFPAAGDCFGLDNYIRIGIGVPRERLQEGLRRISEFVAENPALRQS